MPDILPAPVWTVTMPVNEGPTIFFPLLYPQVTWLRNTPRRLAMKFAEDFQKHYLETGNYLDFLKHVPHLQVESDTFRVSLPRPKDSILYPDISVEFAYCVAQLPDQRWLAMIPALGVEVFAEERDQLTERLQSMVHLEWSRRKRGKSLLSVLPLLWWESVELVSYEMEFPFYSLAELKELANQRKKRMLPEIAQQLVRSTQTTFCIQESLEQLMRVSKGRYYRSVLIVGPAGCGKTALIEEWERTKHTHGLANTLIWKVTAARLLQKLTTDVGWQENLSKLCEELAEYEEFLYIPNFAQLFEVGRYIGNNVSLGEYLRDAIARGQVVVFSECTEEELAHIELRYPGILPFFQIIRMQEPNDTTLQEIVKKKAELLARPYQATWTSEALYECVTLHRRFAPYSGFPGKPIRFLEALLRQDLPPQAILDRRFILREFCKQTGLPEFLISPDIPMPLHTTEEFFRSRLFGQHEAIRIIVDLLASIKAGLSQQKKPIASLLFVGPTGVGKTEMAKVLAEYLFSSRDRMIRFDMSEFSDLGNVMRLTGETMQQDGLLTSVVRQQPFCVLLFDELEKAHSNFYDLLLQILGSGRLTDGRGRTADFCSTVIIMTSNLGTESYSHTSLGFTETSDVHKAQSEHFDKAAQREFRPELYNRIDHVVPFRSLDRETLRHVLERELAKIREREGIRFRDIQLDIDEAATEIIGTHSYHPRYGARHLQRTLRDMLLVRLAQDINHQEPQKPLVAKVSATSNSSNSTEQPKPSDLSPASNDAVSSVFSVSNRNHNMALRIQISAGSQTVWTEKRVEGTGMTLSALTNLLTESRRESQTLEDGPFVIQLHSQLDILERKKKKDEKSFWKDLRQGEHYSQLLALAEACTQSLSGIQHLETTALVSLLHSQPLAPDVFSQFERWRQQFRQLKIQLYTTIESKQNLCTIAIYGDSAHLSDLYDLYRNLSEPRSYTVTQQALWLKEGRKPWQSGMPLQTKEDRAVGLLLRIDGPGSHLYFTGEFGCHTWLDPEDVEFKYVIEVHQQSHQDYKPPKDVHRQSFFDGRKVRRTYSQRRLTDAEYDIDVSSRQHEQILAEYLQRRFEQTITTIVLGQNTESRAETSDSQDDLDE